MGEGQDRGTRLSGIIVQHALNVERHATHPRRERWRCEQRVQLHCECHAILRRHERVQLEHTELADRRICDLADERRQVQSLSGVPRARDQIGDQDVIGTRKGIGGPAYEREQAGREALDLIPCRFRVGAGRRRLKRAHYI